MMAPMLRSIPAVRMISVWAMASVPTITVCWVISDRLVARMNRSFSIVKTIIATIRTKSGLRYGYLCRWTESSE